MTEWNLFWSACEAIVISILLNELIQTIREERSGKCPKTDR